MIIHLNKQFKFKLDFKYKMNANYIWKHIVFINLIAVGSPPAFPILDASLMASASAAAAASAAGDASPPTGAPGDPNATTPQKYSCARCGRSYLHQATLVRHQVS